MKNIKFKWFRERNINFLLNFIIIFIFLFKSSLNYLVLPFKINTPSEKSNITEIISNFVDNKLIITLPIGEPKKNIDFYASMNLYLYYLEEGSCLVDSSPTYSFYNSKSFSLKKNTSYCGVKLDSCSLCHEKLYLYEDLNLKQTTELSPFIFYYGKLSINLNKNSKDICGKIGFQIDNLPYRSYDYDNFITILKKNSKIESYSWFIHYFEKPYKKSEKEFYNGAIIIDIFNQKFFDDFPYIKNEKDYNTIKAIDLESIMAWSFTFDNIYYNINNTRIDFNNKESSLAFENDFIFCPEEFFNSIQNNYFDYFFKNEICFLQKGYYSYIYCDKTKFKENVKIFPVLYLKCNGLGKIFSLKGDDLFKEYNNSLLFMIIFKKYTYKFWTFGKIFMKKYNFYFDNDKKIIGCFDKVIIEKENKFIKFLNKIKWYIFIIIGVVIGFVIGKKIRDKARKLRANELEDKYEYLENKANKDGSDIKKISNYKEIKSQLYDYSSNI